MDRVGRIGLVIPEICGSLDYDFIDGAFQQAKYLGYDLIVYTGILNSIEGYQYDSYVHSLENIYSLLCQQQLDGIIYGAERFHSEEVIQSINNILMQTDTPVLTLGRKYKKFFSMNAEEFSGMYDITKHLITEHHCKKLYCITGIPGHESSEERLRGFREACKDGGIEISEDDIFYGRFWKKIPEEIGVSIAQGKIEKPDAIVCANDVMAVSLIRALTIHGIRVPEDVAVTGYDGGIYAVSCKPTLTTIQGRDIQFGAEAVCRMYEIINGERCNCICGKQNIRFGHSCGCGSMAMLRNNSQWCLEEKVYLQLQKSIDHHSFIATDFIHRMDEAKDLNELASQIDEVGHIFTNVDWIDISLCADWKTNLDAPDNFRQYGYPEQMYLLLSKRFGENEKAQYLYPTTEILPALNKFHEPHMIVMTSLHCNGQIFGYLSMAYRESKWIDLDDSYVNWCDAVSNGLYSLQKRIYLSDYQKQMEELETDPITGMLNKRGFLVHLPEVANRYLTVKQRCMLILFTYFPEKMDAIDPLIAIADIVMNYCNHQLYGKMQDNVFGVLMPMEKEENISAKAVDFIARIETSLRLRFHTEKIPEFLDEVIEVTYDNCNGMEPILHDAVLKLLEKKKMDEDHLFNYKEQIYHLRKSIIANPQLEWNVQEIADKMCISRSHLQRLYKQFFSVSLKDDIISARIKKAMQLLTYTDMRIQEIAEQCGYNNENHFMRQFKERTGATATSYRKQNDASKG